MKNGKTPSWVARLATGFGAVLAVGMTLFGPAGSGSQCLAAYTGGPGDEPTSSFGAFQIQVSPNFTNLFYPTSPGGNAYPGFSPSSGILTSPVGYDPATFIGISGPHNYVYVGQTTPAFPVNPVGGGMMSSPINIIQNMNDYYAVPNDATIPNDPWVFPSPITSPDEVFTEIESFDLMVMTGAFQCGDSRVPGASVNLDMLTAGPDAGPSGGVYPNYVTAQGLRSIGKVQQYLAGDYPGASFFNIFVNVFLPSATGTFSDQYFPGSTGNPTPPPPWPVAYPYTFGIAQLTNGVADPLVIEDTNVMSLPPHVVYIHGQTPAVPLHFKYDNKPYWNAGDLLGYITLAGHGVLNCTNDSTGGGGQQDSNCCSVVGELLDATFGPTNAPLPSMAVGWPETVNTLPSPGRALQSLQNVVVQDGVTNDLSDSLSFQLGVGEVVTISKLILSNVSNSVAPPAPNTVATVNDTNIGVNFTLSFNGTAPVSCVGTGVLSMSISNNGVANPHIDYGTNQPGYMSYTVQLLQLTARVNSLDGGFFIQVDPSSTNESLGLATIADVAGGYNVSFFNDAHLMLGTTPTSYTGSISNRTLRLYRSMSPATPVVPYIVPAYSLAKPKQVVLKWPGSATLQSTPSLSGAIQWTDITSSNTYAPYTFIFNTTNHMFFRLKQP